MKKLVYFVRHGESGGNVGTIYQPLDSPLNTKGKEQAAFIARRVLSLSFESMISSPLRRTKETAEIIAASVGKKIEFCDLFVERKKPTNLNGKPYTDNDANTLNLEWEKSLYTSGYRAEDGENFDEIVDRADEALEYLAKRPDSRLLVVTHGYFLRTILARILLGDTIDDATFKHFQSRIRSTNTGITVLEHDTDLPSPSWRLLVWNDHAHLG